MESPRTGRARLRGSILRSALLLLVGALLGANAVYFLMVRERPRPPPVVDARAPVKVSPAPAQPPPPTRATPAPADGLQPPTVPEAPPATPAPSLQPDTVAPAAAATGAAAANSAAAPSGLLIPVAGISASALSDTYSDARGIGRVHEALDIMAPAGTPVLAVADGHVEKLFDSDQGGLTIYQFEPTGSYAYYYAHLQAYAPGLAEGREVRRGEVIGYVGSTGNANAAAPHLHFGIFLLGPEKRWWQGTALNPYPLLGGK